MEIKNFSLPPLLEPEFEDTFKVIQHIPEHTTDIPSEQRNRNIAPVPNPKLVQIGDGVSATDSIPPTTSTSIENDIKNCFDTLFCTTPRNKS